MKAKALRIGKAISAALFVLLLVVVGSKNALAQTQVATLQHGDDISVFYGPNAFVQAHGAATHGDIITLSSGTFVGCNITKAITLRGAGCAIDTVTNTYPTSFDRLVSLRMSSNTSNYLTIEGILFTEQVTTHNRLDNPKFNKCTFTSLSPGYGTMYDAQFDNCIIDYFDFRYTQNTVLINSVIWQPGFISNDYPVVLYNSIMKLADYSFSGLSAYNSIIIKANNVYNSEPSPTCSFINCIGINLYNHNPFGLGSTINCTIYHSYEAVFESFTGNFSLDELFILKDEIATSILGNDGTQVGIYGGFLPYSNIPSYMLRTNVSVPNRSNIDGTLNVEIEVIDDDQ